jgi:hypothetical protein
MPPLSFIPASEYIGKEYPVGVATVSNTALADEALF